MVGSSVSREANEAECALARIAQHLRLHRSPFENGTPLDPEFAQQPVRRLRGACDHARGARPGPQSRLRHRRSRAHPGPAPHPPRPLRVAGLVAPGGLARHDRLSGERSPRRPQASRTAGPTRGPWTLRVSRRRTFGFSFGLATSGCGSIRSDADRARDGRDGYVCLGGNYRGILGTRPGKCKPRSGYLPVLMAPPMKYPIRAATEFRMVLATSPVARATMAAPNGTAAAWFSAVGAFQSVERPSA